MMLKVKFSVTSDFFFYPNKTNKYTYKNTEIPLMEIYRDRYAHTSTSTHRQSDKRTTPQTHTTQMCGTGLHVCTLMHVVAVFG